MSNHETEQETGIERTGIVIEALPNIMFKVKLDMPNGEISTDESELLAYLSGRMRLHRIRVIVGDRVILKLEPYGGKARITKRL
jgi:translation initiation factor IF-1